MQSGSLHRKTRVASRKGLKGRKAMRKAKEAIIWPAEEAIGFTQNPSPLFLCGLGDLCVSFKFRIWSDAVNHAPFIRNGLCAD
jgi:hypothetical protein